MFQKAIAKKQALQMWRGFGQSETFKAGSVLDQLKKLRSSQTV